MPISLTKSRILLLWIMVAVAATFWTMSNQDRLLDSDNREPSTADRLIETISIVDSVDTEYVKKPVVESGVEAEEDSWTRGIASLASPKSITELPEDQLRLFYEERKKHGYFQDEDASRYGYTAYDHKTVAALAKNGDALAEFLVVSNISDYPATLRREIALSSALNGRTFGLNSYGSTVFAFLEPDPLAVVDLLEPTDENLVEAYGMLLAAMRLGDALPLGPGSSIQIAQSRLSNAQIESAREYATNLVDAIDRQDVR